MKAATRRSALVAWSVLSGAALCGAQNFSFIEPAGAGLEAYTMAPGMGGGVAAVDYDDDGDVDLFVPTSEGTPHQLYRNISPIGGPILFEEVAADVGLDSLERGRTALWLDANGDARLDLVVASGCWQTTCVPGTSLQRLYLQTVAGTFVDASAGSGLFDDAAAGSLWHRGGMAAGDYDRDGDPDLYVTIWRGGTRLYRNEGDGTFVDVSVATGAGEPPHTGVGPWQAMFHDFNVDGRPDILVAVDFAPDQLLIQQPNGTFEDVAADLGIDIAWNGMGLALGDPDADGDFDYYVTNISDEFFGEMRHSVFLRNDSVGGNLAFTEVSEALAIDDVGWGWGVTFLDANNDRALDLAATNGFDTAVDASRLFLNDGGASLSFTDVSAAVGFDDDEWGSSLLALDLDRDGDLDLVQTCQYGPLRVLENTLVAANDARWLTVRPRRSGPYPRPLGARVEVEVGSDVLVRLVTAGTSFLGQEPAEAHFGLGSAATVDRVTVHWPTGGSTTLEDVPTNQILDVTDLLFGDGFEAGDVSAWSATTP